MTHLHSVQKYFPTTRTHDVASPAAVDLIPSVVVIGPNSFHQLSQRTLVFQVNLSEGNSGAHPCLLVDQPPQPRLAFDDAVGDQHLATEGTNSIGSVLWSIATN